jgi:Rhs element Vgr protein
MNPMPSPNDSLQKTLSFVVKLNNKKLDAKYQVMSIHVWHEVNKVGRARVAIVAGNAYLNTFAESEVADFAPGKDVEISLGYDSTNTVVFKGMVLRHRIDIREGYLNFASRSLLVLDCADKAVKLTFGRKTALYENKLDSAVITSIASTAGVQKTVTATTVTHPSLVQYDMSDWDFILKRARANGMVMYNSLNKLTVKAPAVTGSAVMTLTQGEDVSSFRGDVDAGTQFQSVEAKSWDPFKEADAKSKGAEPSNLDKPGDKVGKTLGKVAAPTTFDLGVKAPLDKTELKELADAVLVDARFRRVRGEVSFRGAGSVALGSIVKLAGFGTVFNGDALVTAVQHVVQDGGWTTTAGFGLPDGLMEAPAMERDDNRWLGPVSGLHVGIVKKLDADPLGKYRIKVMIPSIKSTGEGVWALLSQFYATNKAGSFFVPEVNAEVIVGFLNDDPRYPVVLGCLYDNKNKPKESLTAANSVKAILSKEKLTLKFDDKDKVITLETPGKNQIVISDKGKSITIKDQNGNSIVASASGIALTSKKSITFDSKDEIKITATKAVTIKSSTNAVKLDGKDVTANAKAGFKVTAAAGADIKASGTVNIKGAMVNVN